jgi:hypothetical protein
MEKNASLENCYCQVDYLCNNFCTTVETSKPLDWMPVTSLDALIVGLAAPYTIVLFARLGDLGTFASCGDNATCFLGGWLKVLLVMINMFKMIKYEYDMH